MIDRKLKINIVLPFLSGGPGGGLKVMYQYANQLAKKGHDVVIYHAKHTSWTTNGNLKKGKFFFQKHFLVPEEKGPVWYDLDPSIKSFEILKVDNVLIHNADIILCTWWATATEISFLNKRKGQKFNLIQDYEAVMTNHPELVDKSFLLNLHHIVIANYLAELLESKTNKRPPVIPNAIDPRQFFMETPIEQKNRFNICMLYSDDKRKGTAYGLEALKIVAQKYPEIKVHLFGVYQKPMIPFPDTFEYHYQPDNLREIYNNAAIFISPSIHEGWGLPPMEAMACGCACVCTKVGGHVDFMIDEQTVLFVEVAQFKQMAEKIITLIENDNLRMQLAKQANNHIKQFSWEQSCNKLEQLFYDSLPQ